ncbi:hypothetical protein C8R45DRAFT_489653 [Mycena sanguinolenta]|nr:hypothetical protein C8R45DRAFT_489653 [Mycena sanguinolenta]
MDLAIFDFDGLDELVEAVITLRVNLVQWMSGDASYVPPGSASSSFGGDVLLRAATDVGSGGPGGGESGVNVFLGIARMRGQIGQRRRRRHQSVQSRDRGLGVARLCGTLGRLRGTVSSGVERCVYCAKSADPASRTAPPAAHRRANYLISNEDPSAPLTVPTPRKRHRNRRRNTVADMGNTSEDGNRRGRRTQTWHVNRAVKRARNAAASPDVGRSFRNQQANTRFDRGETSSNAGGTGGAGGSGGLIGGPGGNGTGTVFNLVFHFPR